MSEVILQSISKRFGQVLAVNDLNLHIKDREFMALVGPSGCGKTTTLRIIAGLEKQDAGNVFIDGVLVNDIKPEKRGIHMVFQHYALWPHMKVFDEKEFTNISFALKLRKWVSEDIVKRANSISMKVGLDKSLFSRRPDQLSAGQQQRVAMGRSLILTPKVLLMDEPMANLDPPSRVKVREELLSLHKELKLTTLYVTHNMADAMSLADRLVVMREGRIVQVDTPARIYESPADDFVKDFVRAYDALSAIRSKAAA